ncbi:carbon-nitrogen hydrolase family protein [Mariprofundus ferrooxydans]|nr:carbon-nitrogen hydrolase family protein [Mariprofundus ferrooxydans]
MAKYKNVPLQVACMQLCSSDDVLQNLQHIEQLLADHAQPIDVLLLPENATLITHDIQRKQHHAQPSECNKIQQHFSSLAKTNKCWLIAGSMLIQDGNNPDKFLNHSPVFSPEGKLVAAYNKMHLFDVDLGSESWQESAQISAGKTPETVTLNEHWKVGLSICYDLRFPELYRKYSAQNCNILSIPAAFTVPTGKAHWDILLKARAIENQAYVLAAGQVGSHADGRKTFGHSKIINPWGETLAELKEGEGIITAKLDLDELNDLKKRMPVLQHRRLS